MHIYLASDHGGFQLKNFLLDYLKGKDLPVEDMGPFDPNSTDDYPQITKLAITKVQESLGKTPEDKAILICRNGVGVTIFANRHKGIRAGLSWGVAHAKSHRLDDDTNVLTLPADYIDNDLALEIVLAWLSTDFLQEERHIRRINQIEELS